MFVLTEELSANSRDTRVPEGTLDESSASIRLSLGRTCCTGDPSWWSEDPRHELPTQKWTSKSESSGLRRGELTRAWASVSSSPRDSEESCGYCSTPVQALRGHRRANTPLRSRRTVIGLSARTRPRGGRRPVLESPEVPRDRHWSLHTPQAPWLSVCWCVERPDGSEEPPGCSATVARTATAHPRSTDLSSSPRCRQTSRRPYLSPKKRQSSLSPTPDTPKSPFAAEDPYPRSLLKPAFLPRPLPPSPRRWRLTPGHSSRLRPVSSRRHRVRCPSPEGPCQPLRHRCGGPENSIARPAGSCAPKNTLTMPGR